MTSNKPKFGASFLNPSTIVASTSHSEEISKDKNITADKDLALKSPLDITSTSTIIKLPSKQEQHQLSETASISASANLSPKHLSHIVATVPATARKPTSEPTSFAEYVAQAERRVQAQQDLTHQSQASRPQYALETQPRLSDVIRGFDHSCGKRRFTRGLTMSSGDITASLAEGGFTREFPLYPNAYQILITSPKIALGQGNTYFLQPNRGVVGWNDPSCCIRIMFATVGAGIISFSLTGMCVTSQLPPSHAATAETAASPTATAYIAVSLNGTSSTVRIPSNGVAAEHYLTSFRVTKSGYHCLELILPPGLRTAITAYGLKLDCSKAVGGIFASDHVSGGDAIGSLLGPSLVLRYKTPRTSVTGFYSEMHLGMKDDAPGSMISPISVDNVNVSYSHVANMGFGITAAFSCDDTNVFQTAPPVLLECDRTCLISSHSDREITAVGGELRVFYPIRLQHGAKYGFSVQVEPFLTAEVGAIPVYTVYTYLPKRTEDSDAAKIVEVAEFSPTLEEVENEKTPEKSDFEYEKHLVKTFIARVAIPAQYSPLRDIDAMMKNVSSDPRSSFAQRSVSFTNQQYLCVESKTGNSGTKETSISTLSLPIQSNLDVQSKVYQVLEGRCVADIPGRDKSRVDWACEVNEHSFILRHCGFGHTTAATYPSTGLVISREAAEDK